MPPADLTAPVRGRRRIAVVAVVALLALAGCGGSPGSDPVDRDTYEVPDRPDAVDPGEEDVAPGLTQDGIRNAFSMVEAHKLRLSSRSLRVRRLRRVARNGTVVSERRVDARVGPDRRRYLIVVENRHGERRVRESFYSGGARTLGTRTERGGVRTFETVAGDAPVSPDRLLVGEVTYRNVLYRYLSGARDVSVTQRSAPDDPGEYATYRVRTDAFDPGHSLHPGIDGEVAETTLRMVVDGRGLVTRLRVESTLLHNGTTIRVVDRFRFGGVGSTTVVAPGWVDEARDRLGFANGSTGESSTRGGDAHSDGYDDSTLANQALRPAVPGVSSTVLRAPGP